MFFDIVCCSIKRIYFEKGVKCMGGLVKTFGKPVLTALAFVFIIWLIFWVIPILIPDLLS
jgi:hypothetical protein